MLIYAHAHTYNDFYEATLVVVYIYLLIMQNDVYYFNISPVFPYTVSYDWHQCLH